MTHGAFCWNTTLHVPLADPLPGRLARGRARARSSSASWTSRRRSPRSSGRQLGPDIDRRSLLAPRAGGARRLLRGPTPGYLAFGWSPIAGWIDERGKYVHCSRPELYDLAQDPGEEHDLARRRRAGASGALPRRDRGRRRGKPALVGKSAARSTARCAPASRDLGYARGRSAAESAIPHRSRRTSARARTRWSARGAVDARARTLMNRGRFARRPRRSCTGARSRTIQATASCAGSPRDRR